MRFNHSGSLGDVLYSLTFAREYASARGVRSFDLHLRVNVVSGSPLPHPAGRYRMTEPLAEWLRPLLEAQPYIGSVTISPDAPADAFDLDCTRELPVYASAGEIRYYYYALSPAPLPKDFAAPVLTAAPDARAAGRIVVFRSGRYHNPQIDLRGLRDLAPRMMFLGLPEEHDAFCREVFPVEYMPTDSALEAAELIAGADLTIGNQTALFAVAEQLKVPRWLESCQLMDYDGRPCWGCPNVLPFGGKCRQLVTPPTASEVANYG